MKKLIVALAVCSAMVCSAVSCGDSSSSGSSKTAAAKTSEAAVEEVSEAEFVDEDAEPTTEKRIVVGVPLAQELVLATSSALYEFKENGVNVEGKYLICSDRSKSVGLENFDEDKLYEKIIHNCDKIPLGEACYVIYCEDGAVLDAAAAGSFDSEDVVESGSKTTGAATLDGVISAFSK